MFVSNRDFIPEGRISEQINILSVDLLESERELVDSFRRLAGRMKIELGWHYLLDMAWVAHNLGDPHGKKILDAGAGTGVMQWWLAERGARVISVDRVTRAKLSTSFRLRYNLSGLRPQDLATGWDLLRWRLGACPDSTADLLGALRAVVGFAIARWLPKASGRVILYDQDLTKLEDLPDGTVDVIVAVSSLEHNPPEALVEVVCELLRVLKPGGYLIMTLAAASDHDWFHENSQGWCYTEPTLRRIFGLSSECPSNYDQYDVLFERLKKCEELRANLASFYFRSGDNGMPWGIWDPKYQPVGVIKVKAA